MFFLNIKHYTAISFLIFSFASTISLHNIVYAQNPKTTGHGSSITNLTINGKPHHLKGTLTIEGL
jgi:hypothetical protein